MVTALFRRQVERIRRASPQVRKAYEEFAACILGLTIGCGMGVLVMLELH